MQQTERGKIQEEEEISLIDIIRFLGRNWKLITLTTAGLSAIAIFLSYLQPKQYQTQLTLSVKPIQIMPGLPQFIPGLDVKQANDVAVELLQTQPLEQIVATPNYDPTNQKIGITLRSTTPTVLRGLGDTIADELATGFEEVIGSNVENALSYQKLQIKKHQEVLNQIEKEIAQTSPSNTAKLEALEEQRSVYLTAIASLTFDQNELELAQKNMAEFAAQALLINVLSESGVLQTGSVKKMVVVAILVSFILAVLAALIREQIPRLRQELEEKKPQK
ncbi:MAG: Wzz/FepE/Etk N-terminal domain-containing protein [Coleofasciculaceae cyanobacterium]